MSIITLTSDFGISDAYVGMMKGTILTINPDARMIDVTHDVAPQAVRQAAYILSTAAPYFPADTIHLAVVDPGVGTSRRPIAVRTPSAYFVGPDNGVFSLFLSPPTVPEAETQRAGDAETGAARVSGRATVVHVLNSRYWRPEVSQTFHGRDIFAPVAAHLSRGVPLGELGEPVDDPVIVPVFQSKREMDGSVSGHVLHVDHFGNLVTDIPARLLAEAAGLKAPGGESRSAPVATGREFVVELGGRTISGLVPTYGSVERGQFLALLGSAGLLEIAVREGSAARLTGAAVGDRLVVRVDERSRRDRTWNHS